MELEIRIGVSQVLILIAFMFSFVLAMTAAFIGAPAIGGELESGVAQAILARPLRRSDVLLGRWLGSAVVVVGYTVASGCSLPTETPLGNIDAMMESVRELGYPVTAEALARLRARSEPRPTVVPEGRRSP